MVGASWSPDYQSGRPRLASELAVRAERGRLAEAERLLWRWMGYGKDDAIPQLIDATSAFLAGTTPPSPACPKCGATMPCTNMACLENWCKTCGGRGYWIDRMDSGKEFRRTCEACSPPPPATDRRCWHHGAPLVRTTTRGESYECGCVTMFNRLDLMADTPPAPASVECPWCETMVAPDTKRCPQCGQPDVGAENPPALDEGELREAVEALLPALRLFDRCHLDLGCADCCKHGRDVARCADRVLAAYDRAHPAKKQGGNDAG